MFDFFSFAVMTTSTPEKADGLKALENAIEKIRETITKTGGVFNINMAVSITLLDNIHLNIAQLFECIYFKQPKVVTAIDEADLARRMERAEAENAEIDGDEDEEEDGLKYDGDAGEDDNEDAAGSEEEKSPTSN